MPFFETKKKITEDTTVVGRYKILIGNCLERLKDIPDESVHCCVTSPPYWGLRDYGTAEWEGGDPECDHVGSDVVMKSGGDGLQYLKKGHEKNLVARGNCSKCGAVRIDDQIGLEKTPDEYVATMVKVFREVRRVLRSDGCCWLNLGDSYSSSREMGTSDNGRGDASGLSGVNKFARSSEKKGRDSKIVGDLKPKDLVGIPWRVAFALQADGWWLRQDIIWAKDNPMPEPVTDRCVKAHEYVFLFAKSGRYFFDYEAIREESVNKWNPKKGFGTLRRKAAFMTETQMDLQQTQFVHKTHHDDEDKTGRNKRSVWNISSMPYSEAHFATFPPDLVIPCIKAGTSQKGCCSKCGNPWEKVMQKETVDTVDYNGKHAEADPQSAGRRILANVRGRRKAGNDHDNPFPAPVVLGWQPACDCNAEVVPCTVLDPFLGSGTTLQVARNLGRNGIGIELSGDFAAMAKNRIMKPLYE